jgi:hypothetical protein
VQKEAQVDFMHFVGIGEGGIGEGENFSRQACKAISQCQVQAFEMVGATLSALFLTEPMLRFGNHAAINSMGISENRPETIVRPCLWQITKALPQLMSSCNVAFAKSVTDDLASAVTQYRPQPERIAFITDK